MFGSFLLDRLFQGVGVDRDQAATDDARIVDGAPVEHDEVTRFADVAVMVDQFTFQVTQKVAFGSQARVRRRAHEGLLAGVLPTNPPSR